MHINIDFYIASYMSENCTNYWGLYLEGGLGMYYMNINVIHKTTRENNKNALVTSRALTKNYWGDKYQNMRRRKSTILLWFTFVYIYVCSCWDIESYLLCKWP